MALPTHIIDGGGTRRKAIVDDTLALCVRMYPEPPIQAQKLKPFRQYLTTDGTASGSNDMGVDGSSTNVDFYVPADDTDDRYITSLSFIIGYGTSGQPNEWADGTALSNGSRLFYESARGENDIHDAIKANQDMFRLSFNPIPTAWELRHVNSTNDYGYFIYTDLAKIIPPFGIKLDRGTDQRLVIRIRDNAGADADAFNCIAYGFDRFE